MFKKNKKVITFGTFDLLHEGHIQILKRAKSQGDYLVVGVSSDQLNDRKGKRSVFSESQRMMYVNALKYVDEVFLEESLELKDQYIKEHQADLLVMGDDWKGKFDWVSCTTRYLPRTEGVSSTLLKTEIEQQNNCRRVLFGDTYLTKHMDCALTMVNQLTDQNVAPILTNQNSLPRMLNADVLAYFNKPINAPHPEYNQNKRVLIDHGASHLKWFLGSKARFDFFDLILTAGPDHVRALEAIFPETQSLNKVRATGFIKSKDLLSPSKMSREEICEHANLDPNKPIILFAPTWHISANADIIDAINELQKFDNHVASFHPETAHLPINDLNMVKNINGITAELIKHADVVISDLSSTIYEAAALNKPIVQVLLKEYPDNVANLYDLPLSAGTAEHFCGGLTCRPKELIETIKKALQADSDTQALMSACRDRILAGTYIAEDATQSITDQLVLSCGSPRLAPAETETIAPATTAAAFPRYHKNLFYAQNRIIAHGAGNFGPHHASNSKEAIEAAFKATKIVELDLCLGNDGVIVAHDGLEPHYGLDQSFEKTGVADFLSRQFANELSPLSLSEAIRLGARNGRALVCDIKPTKEKYNTVAQTIRQEVENQGADLESIVLQCYSVENFSEAMRLGFKRVMLPVWKYFYRAPVGQEAFNFFKTCIEINADAVCGLSIPYQNKHMPTPSVDTPGFARFHSFWKRIFIHGAPPEQYPRLLERNLGLFADGFTRQIQFRDKPDNFDWKTYLFLNRDLIKADRVNEVQALQHYLNYGQKEKRHIAYNKPEGFSWMGYMNKNPSLRKADINSIDSAAAHYTKIGATQGLKF